MMKLYFRPEAISLAPHITLAELDFPYKLVRVNHLTLQTSEGQSFLEINSSGYLPALQLDNGQVLTEAVAIMQYLADLKPESGLAPLFGSWERVELWEALNFLGNEITALCTPLFMPEMPDEVKVMLIAKLKKHLDYASSRIGSRTYALGEQFTIVDAYLFPVLSWMPRFTIDLLQWPNLASLLQRLSKRPAVKKALKEEMAFPPV